MIGLQDIKAFYDNRRIAVIGASRDSNKYGHHLLLALSQRGIEAIPVNPNAAEIAGKKCYAKVGQVPGGVAAAIAVVPPDQQDKVAEECAAAGVKTLWLHEHVMKGISNTRAIAVAEQKGVKVITGFCPMMFMPHNGFPHNIHKAIMGLFGALPK